MIDFIKDVIHAYKVISFQNRMTQQIAESQKLEQLNNALSAVIILPEQTGDNYASLENNFKRSLEHKKQGKETQMTVDDIERLRMYIHYHQEKIDILKEYLDAQIRGSDIGFGSGAKWEVERAISKVARSSDHAKEGELTGTYYIVEE